MAIVCGEDAELDVAEIAGDGRPVAHRLILAIDQLVVPREVEDSRGALFFRHGDTFGAEPVGKIRVAARGVHDDVGAHFCRHAVLLDIQSVDDEETVAVAMRDDTADRRIAHETDAGERLRKAAHHKLERRAPAEHDRQIFIARLKLVARPERGRQPVLETEDAHAFFQELGEKIGIAFADQRGETAEKDMAVAKLRRATPLPAGECILGRTGGRGGVAIENGDPPSTVAERKRGAKASDPAARDENVFAHGASLVAA